MNDMTSTINDARGQVRDAQADLDNALATDGDAAGARERLRLAREELERLEALTAAEESRQRAAHAEVLHRQAEEMTATAVRAIEDEAAGFARVDVPPIQLPAGSALALLQAQQEHGNALGAFNAARRDVDALEERRRTLQAERQAIVDRRARGEHRKDDGARLELIAADVEGLNDLIQREADKLPAPPDALRQQAENFANQWQMAQREARVTALLAVARDLEARLMAVADQLNATSPGANVHGRWIPSARLRGGIRSGVWSG